MLIVHDYVFAQSDAAATIYFITQFIAASIRAATIRERRLFMERRMRQNYLIYNRKTSDPRKWIIGCPSLEIESKFDFRRSTSDNRFSGIACLSVIN